MEAVISFLQVQSNYIIYGCFVFVIFFSIILLHKMNKMTRRLNGIYDEVKGYINFVLREEENAKKEAQIQEKQDKERQNEEEKNQLISAVLQEIFP